jgi:hypothetical protein
MTITPEEKSKIFKARNDLLIKVNEALHQQYYLDAVLLLEDAIVMSNKIGESERVTEYNQKKSECIEKIFSLFAADDQPESDLEEKSSLQEEREKLIHSAQESVQNRRFQDAVNEYRNAMEISIKLKDKMAIWKITKSISILGEKITPSELLSTYFVETQPAKEVETKQPELKSTKKPPFSSPSMPTPKPSSNEPEMKRREFTIVSKPSPQSPPGKELPFFKAVIPEKEPQEIEERKEAIPSPKDSGKKLKKEAEKKEIDRKRAEKKEAEKKEAVKKETKKEDIKKQTKKEAVKKEIKKETKTETPKIGLSSDVLAEIKSFKHEELNSSPPPSTTAEPKKQISSKIALPADIMEELKKRRKKNE